MNTCELKVPDGQSGDWKVESFTVSEEDANRANIRAIFRPFERISAGNYKRLMHKNNVVMSNTPMEIDTNNPIIRRATGITLLNGLGLGVVPSIILQKQDLKQLYIVEKSKDVIKLVGPTFSLDPRVKIIHADAFKYVPPRKIYFNAVWHDIWNFICTDNASEMTKLRDKYRKITAWQGCWCERECMREY